MRTFCYKCSPVRTGLSSIDDSGRPWSIRFKIYNAFDHGEPDPVADTDFINDEIPVLEGVLDWQDGVSIYHTENLEPCEWSELSTTILTALKEATTMLGDNFRLGGMNEPA